MLPLLDCTAAALLRYGRCTAVPQDLPRGPRQQPGRLAASERAEAGGDVPDGGQRSEAGAHAAAAGGARVGRVTKSVDWVTGSFVWVTESVDWSVAAVVAGGVNVPLSSVRCHYWYAAPKLNALFSSTLAAQSAVGRPPSCFVGAALAAGSGCRVVASALALTRVCVGSIVYRRYLRTRAWLCRLLRLLLLGSALSFTVLCTPSPCSVPHSFTNPLVIRRPLQMVAPEARVLSLLLCGVVAAGPRLQPRLRGELHWRVQPLLGALLTSHWEPGGSPLSLSLSARAAVSATAPAVPTYPPHP